jgi:hypothetical protein
MCHITLISEPLRQHIRSTEQHLLHLHSRRTELRRDPGSAPQTVCRCRRPAGASGRGTHDNDTTAGWWTTATATDHERRFVRAYLATAGHDMPTDHATDKARGRGGPGGCYGRANFTNGSKCESQMSHVAAATIEQFNHSPLTRLLLPLMMRLPRLS